MNEMIEKIELHLLENEEEINSVDNKIEVLKLDKQRLVVEKKKLNSALTKLRTAKESYDELEKM